MVVITVENYLNAGVHIITVENEELFWVKMDDVKRGLGIKVFLIYYEKKCVLFLRLKILQKNKKDM